jgi:hypothetical protein
MPGWARAGRDTEDMRVRAFPPQSGLPAELRGLRRLARRTILFLLVLLPPVLAWLADRAGMGWELVTLMGVALALGVGGAHRRQPTVMATGLAAGCVLVLGAGHGVLPSGVATALPFAALILAAALCDGRALGVAFALLLGPAVLASSMEMAAGMAALATLAWLAQGLACRVLAGRTVVLVPSSAPSAPVWTRPAEGFALPGLLVQAERGADGAVRLAVAGHAAGRLRVSVR